MNSQCIYVVPNYMSIIYLICGKNNNECAINVMNLVHTPPLGMLGGKGEKHYFNEIDLGIPVEGCQYRLFATIGKKEFAIKALNDCKVCIPKIIKKLNLK